MNKGFAHLALFVIAALGLIVIGSGAYFLSPNTREAPPAIEEHKDPIDTNAKPAIEVLSLAHPVLTYRVNEVKDSNAWLRITDVPSGLVMWDKSGIELGTHEIDLAGLVPYEDFTISLPAGTYRLRLEVFKNSIGTVLGESGTFTVPGTVVAVPTCAIKGDRPTNPTQLTWSSENADEAYIAHSPGKGGSPVIYGLMTGEKVSLNGSYAVNTFTDEGYWLVVKNARGATICRPDGTTYFDSQEEIENPPTMG